MIERLAARWNRWVSSSARRRGRLPFLVVNVVRRQGDVTMYWPAMLVWKRTQGHQRVPLWFGRKVKGR